MEILANTFGKISKTTSDSFKNLLHLKPVNNISISNENDKLNDQRKQPSNNI